MGATTSKPSGSSTEEQAKEIENVPEKSNQVIVSETQEEDPLPLRQLNSLTISATASPEPKESPKPQFEDKRIDQIRFLTPKSPQKTAPPKLANILPQQLDPYVEKFNHHLTDQQHALLLLRAAVCLDQSEDEKAEFHTLQALKLVTANDNALGPLAVARCKYWQGRIAWFRGDIERAKTIFHEVHEPLRNLPEGGCIDDFLYMLRKGLDDENQDPTLTLPAEDEGKTQEAQGPHAKSDSKKRKWEEMRAQMRALDVSRVPLRRDALTKRGPKQTIYHRYVQASTHRPPVSNFEFRMYPKGLAPRTRKCDFFPEQPFEFLISADRWEVISQQNEDKYVSMDLLARQRARWLGRLRETLGPGAVVDGWCRARSRP